MEIINKRIKNIKFNFLNQNILGLALTAIVIIYFNLLFYNKYFPLTEGWFSTYSLLINRGYKPYKDFYLFLMPLYPYQLALFQEIFSYKIIFLRTLGIVIMTMSAMFLYLTLNRKFNALTSMIASTASIIYYSSGVAFINYDFTQVMTLYALISTYFILKANDYADKNKGHIYLLISGIFLSLTFLIKQSNGLFIMIFSIIAVLLMCIWFNNNSSLKKLIYFFLGISIPLIILLIWIINNSLLGYFIDQVYYGSINSKGKGIYGIIFSWINRLDYMLIYERLIFYFTLLIYCVALYLLFINKNLISENFRDLKNKHTIILIILFSFLQIIIIQLAYKDKLNFEFLTLIRVYINTNINIDLLVLLIIGFLFLALSIIFSKYKNNSYDFIYLIILLGFLFGNGTSAGIGEISLFLVLAYLIAFLGSLSTKNIYKFIPLIFSLLIIVNYSLLKFDNPYAWWYVNEQSIKSQRGESYQELLSSMKISLKSQKIIDDVVSVVINNSKADDDIFVFPNISGLYFLTDRWPKSKVIVSWFDFLPDNLALEEALRLKRNPPDMIVNLSLPEVAWELHEKYFRNGQRLGQREIQFVISDLINSKNYSRVYLESLDKEVKIEIWKKN